MKHLAVIMDGNGRYAELKGVERSKGHEAGAIAFEKACRDFATLPLDVLTVYAFSTENNSRPKEEVSNILSVIAYFLEKRIHPFAAENGITVRFIGKIDELPQNLKKTISVAPVFEKGKTIVIAINYGGTDEICRAFKKMSENKSDFTPENLINSLDTAGLPLPEAVLRYGGYKRLSNFMPVQTVYSELFFTDKYWPEYEREDFCKVINDFEKIKRNFGGLNA